jgi:hypothetical protein
VDIFSGGSSRQTPKHDTFEQGIDAFADQQNTGILGAQRSGKQQGQQREAVISIRKRKAIEMEKQQQPGTWREGQEQPTDPTVTAVRKRYKYVDSIAEQFDHVAKSAQGDGSFYCTVCKRDCKLSTMGTAAAIDKHQKTDLHKNAMAQNWPLSTDHKKGCLL